MTKATLSDREIDALNAHQKNQQFHPYTCPGNDEKCQNRRELIATKKGWVCQCGEYTQEYYNNRFPKEQKEQKLREIIYESCLSFIQKISSCVKQLNWFSKIRKID